MRRSGRKPRRRWRSGRSARWGIRTPARSLGSSSTSQAILSARWSPRGGRAAREGPPLKHCALLRGVSRACSGDGSPRRTRRSTEKRGPSGTTASHGGHGGHGPFLGGCVARRRGLRERRGRRRAEASAAGILGHERGLHGNHLSPSPSRSSRTLRLRARCWAGRETPTSPWPPGACPLPSLHFRPALPKSNPRHFSYRAPKGRT